jgi:plasmid stability protein
MKNKGESHVPEFRTLQEEREYWEARGSLAEGRRGRVSRPAGGARRTSFLAVRLSGKELTELRDAAARHGLGPSTYARLILLAALQRPEELPHRAPSAAASGGVTLEELQAMQQQLKQRVAEMEALLAGEILQLKGEFEAAWRKTG